MEDLWEMCGFLKINARFDLKAMALQYILGLSGNEDGLTMIAQYADALEQIILLLDDEPQIKQDVLLCLVNISAEDVGIHGLMQFETRKLKFDKSGEQSLITQLAKNMLDPNEKDADAACMTLCNLSRSEVYLNQCVASLMPFISQILDAFSNLNYNFLGGELHYLGPLLSNLTGNHEVRHWICNDSLSNGAAAKIVSFCRFEYSTVRRGGAVGAVRNLCFDSDLHEYLLSPKVDLLSYVLYPLAGGEEFDEEEMSKLPILLQYLPSEKQREKDPDIRMMLLESLNKLCMRKEGREYLRQNGVYYILRELHKWEKDRRTLLACENVVDILIRTESEIMVDDIASVSVPKEYEEKFAKMDDDFVKDS